MAQRRGTSSFCRQYAHDGSLNRRPAGADSVIPGEWRSLFCSRALPSDQVTAQPQNRVFHLAVEVCDSCAQVSVAPERGDRHKQTGRRRQNRLREKLSNRSHARRSFAATSWEGIHDSPNRTDHPYERSRHRHRSECPQTVGELLMHEPGGTLRCMFCGNDTPIHPRYRHRRSRFVPTAGETPSVIMPRFDPEFCELLRRHSV